MTTISYEDQKALLLLNRLGIGGRRKALGLFAEGKAPQEVVSILEAEWKKAGIDFNPEKELALCWEQRISLLTILDPIYPTSLKEIPDPPLLLYAKGEIRADDTNAIAIVGTRHPSFYGRTQAKKFSSDLAAKGFTIVSGLARGIDQVAHEAALSVSYGRTIAVLGSGLDVIYPRENEKLFHQITERGVALSEYGIGTPPLAENFPRRNRILSGLSLGVLVVEAHSRSGSLITAHQALDQGREVFALPGPVDQLTSRGTHLLLKEGAALVENPEDIFDAVVPQLKRTDRSDASKLPPCPVLPEVEKKTTESFVVDGDTAVVEEALLEGNSLTQDEILDCTGLEPSQLPALLLKLELGGRVKRGADGKYQTFPKSNGFSKTASS